MTLTTNKETQGSRRKELQDLSAAVARTVMGLDVRRVTDGDGGTAVPGVWLNDSREMAMPGDWYWVDGEGRELAVPKYAESAEVAMDVLHWIRARLRQRGYLDSHFLDLSAYNRHTPLSQPLGRWRAVFTINEQMHYAGEGDSLAGVNDETIRRWCRDGLVKYEDIGGQTAVSRQSLALHISGQGKPRRKKKSDKLPAVTDRPTAKQSEIDRNRALLNEKISQARTAVLLDVDGRVVGRIERKS